MLIRFKKLTAQGNDYIYIEIDHHDMSKINIPLLAKELSDRHFGIGGDGVVFLSDHEQADVEMRIFNADGSEAEMCGSALRSTVYLKCLELEKKYITVKTNAGIQKGTCVSNNIIEVSMPFPSIVKEATLHIDDFTIEGYEVNVGNPHFVVLKHEHLDLFSYGNKIALHPSFPFQTNVEFVKIVDNASIQVEVWERGSGITLACGTGACAAAYVAHKLGFVNDNIEVALPGGIVNVAFASTMNCLLSGAVSYVFAGNIDIGRYLHE